MKQFSLKTFLADFAELDKLKYIVYENGVEAMRDLGILTATTEAYARYSNNPAFHKVGEYLTDSDKTVGFLIGKVNKGTVSHVYSCLNAYLFPNGQVAIFNPYNSVVSLQVSGSRKHTFEGTVEELAAASPDDILKRSVARGNGINTYTNELNDCRWCVPANAVKVANLLITITTNPIDGKRTIMLEGKLEK